ncbi:MAG: hypothetical protein ACYCW6_05695 [Candidatus Xenobia bacterium]
MEMTIRHLPNGTVIALRQPSLEAYVPFRQSFRDALAVGRHRILIVLSADEPITWDGLAVLVALVARSIEQGRQVTVVAPRADQREALLRVTLEGARVVPSDDLVDNTLSVH